ncbi:hypothetical protein [Dysosmobacter sp.]|uniref:hypothetical protein n=1 Tax=Dysosmobacter sp. TaxID=2591382 RepID=UPI002DB5CC76|nr:hypothetical protein [Dysosmobacter sp.]
MFQFAQQKGRRKQHTRGGVPLPAPLSGCILKTILGQSQVVPDSARYYRLLFPVCQPFSPLSFSTVSQSSATSECQKPQAAATLETFNISFTLHGVSFVAEFCFILAKLTISGEQENVYIVRFPSVTLLNFSPSFKQNLQKNLFFSCLALFVEIHGTIFAYIVK